MVKVCGVSCALVVPAYLTLQYCDNRFLSRLLKVRNTTSRTLHLVNYRQITMDADD